MTEPIFRLNDHIISMTGLKRTDTDAFVNDASTAEVTLRDEAGDPLAGASWPLTLAYIVASDGNYEAVLDKAVVLVIGEFYDAEFTFVKDALDGFWELPLQAQRRRD